MISPLNILPTNDSVLPKGQITMSVNANEPRALIRAPEPAEKAADPSLTK